MNISFSLSLSIYLYMQLPDVAILVLSQGIFMEQALRLAAPDDAQNQWRRRGMGLRNDEARVVFSNNTTM